jgi:hypothetical protein
MRLSLPLALWVVMLVTASVAAHGRVFVSAGVGAPAHRITVVPPAVAVSPGFVTVASFHGVPRVALVIAPQRAIRPGGPVIITRPSATFFPQAAFESARLQGDPPVRVTVPPTGVVPKVIIVVTPGATRQR